MAHVRLERVTKTYGGVTALRDLTLDIAPGEKVALVGPSGAGKSTLTSLIPRFYDVDSGQVLIDGLDVRDVKRLVGRMWVGVSTCARLRICTVSTPVCGVCPAKVL